MRVQRVQRERELDMWKDEKKKITKKKRMRWIKKNKKEILEKSKKYKTYKKKNILKREKTQLNCCTGYINFTPLYLFI